MPSRESKEKKGLQCEICLKIYHCRKSFRRHKETAHVGNPLDGSYVVCPQCQQKFINNQELAKHWIDEHSGHDGTTASTSDFLPLLISTLNNAKRSLAARIKGEEVEAHEDLVHSEGPSIASMDGEDSEGLELEPRRRPETRSILKRVRGGDGDVSEELLRKFVEKRRQWQKVRAERERLRRAFETDDQRNHRQKLEAARQRMRRAEETYEQRTERLRKAAERARIRRLLGTPQQRLLKRRLEAERIKAELETGENSGLPLQLTPGLSWQLTHPAYQGSPVEGINNGARPVKRFRLIPHPTSPQLFETTDSEMPTIRELLAWKDKNEVAPSKAPVCYAIVGIKSVAQRAIFRHIMKKFDFDDLIFVNNPTSVEKLNENSDTREASGPSTSNSCPGSSQPCTSKDSWLGSNLSVVRPEGNDLHREGLQRRDNRPGAIRVITSAEGDHGIRIQAVPPIIASNGISKFQVIRLQALPGTNRVPPSQASSGEAQSVPASAANVKSEPHEAEDEPASEGAVGSPALLSRKSDASRNYSCLICNVSRAAHEVRHSSCKRQQNIVFLASLQAQNIVDMDEAKQIYSELVRGRKRICHEHYMQAAAFIGKEVEEMHGSFPAHGIDEVPCNVKEDLLAYLQVYGEFLDETVTLNCDDIARFFYESLLKYYRAGEWSTLAIHMDSPLGKEDSSENQAKTPKSSASKKPIDRASAKTVKHDELVQNAVLAHGIISGIDVANNEPPLFKETKKEPQLEDEAAAKEKSELGEERTSKEESDQIEEISAMDLMGPETAPQDAPPPPASLVLVGTASISSEGRLSLHLGGSELKEQDSNILGLCSGSALRIFRDSTQSLDTLNDAQFRCRYRMTRKTFLALCKVLQPILERRKPAGFTYATGVVLGMGLEILAGNSFTFAEKSTMRKNGTQVLDYVLDTLLEWSSTMIQWPDEKERRRIGDSFFELTGIKDIVGCIDGTIVKGSPDFNVGFIADDKKRFRWVFAKFRSNVQDCSVFEQSLLCQQLRDGRKGGRLIGDDAYKNEKFLLSPDQGKAKLTEEFLSFAVTLRKAHLLVEDAISELKSQFPLLCAKIKSTRIARIVVSCAALSNLTRNEGEPPFSNSEQDPCKKDSSVIDTVTIN